jgi:hypothetical protein
MAATIRSSTARAIRTGRTGGGGSRIACRRAMAGACWSPAPSSTSTTNASACRRWRTRALALAEESARFGVWGRSVTRIVHLSAGAARPRPRRWCPSPALARALLHPTINPRRTGVRWMRRRVSIDFRLRYPDGISGGVVSHAKRVGDRLARRRAFTDIHDEKRRPDRGDAGAACAGRRGRRRRSVGHRHGRGHGHLLGGRCGAAWAAARADHDADAGGGAHGPSRRFATLRGRASARAGGRAVPLRLPPDVAGRLRALGPQPRPPRESGRPRGTHDRLECGHRSRAADARGLRVSPPAWQAEQVPASA